MTLTFFETATGAENYYNPKTKRTEQHIFFVGANGSLNQSWWDGRSWNSQVLPGSPASWPIALGWAPGNELHVFFKDVSGALAQSWQNASGWSTQLLPGRPARGITAVNSDFYGPEMHVFYVQDNALHQSWQRPDDSWLSQQLPGAPEVALGLSAMSFGVMLNSTRFAHPPEQHVYYRQNGRLTQSWWDGSAWNTQPLPGNPAGAPVALGSQQVFFVDANGTLQRSSYDGSNWNTQALPGSPLGFQLLAIEGSVAVIFYVGKSGRLEFTAGVGSNWSTATLPGRPSLLLGVLPFGVINSSNYGIPIDGPHVFFRGDDGSLQQTWQDVSGNWQNQTLPAATAVRGGFDLP